MTRSLYGRGAAAETVPMPELHNLIAFPLLLDRDVGVVAAVETSARAVAANPVQMALWGLIVVAGLVVGSLLLFAGLAVVIPVLGHATWHLYRKVVAPDAGAVRRVIL